MSNYKALFLDRDGTINIDKYCVHKIDDFEFIEGVFETLKCIQSKGYLLIIITNQSGIGRGMYNEREFYYLCDWMNTVFLDNGIIIDRIYHSPFHPEFGLGKYKKYSLCRKPGPGMILQAENEFNIDLNKSFLVGDKETDILAGLNAGVGCNILFNSTSTSVNTKASFTIHKFKDLLKIIN